MPASGGLAPSEAPPHGEASASNESIADNLTDDIWGLIIGNLKLRQRQALRGTCRSLRALVNRTVTKIKVRRCP